MWSKERYGPNGLYKATLVGNEWQSGTTSWELLQQMSYIWCSKYWLQGDCFVLS